MDLLRYVLKILLLVEPLDFGFLYFKLFLDQTVTRPYPGTTSGFWQLTPQLTSGGYKPPETATGAATTAPTPPDTTVADDFLHSTQHL